jgi:hypothetical protein
VRKVDKNGLKNDVIGYRQESPFSYRNINLEEATKPETVDLQYKGLMMSNRHILDQLDEDSHPLDRVNNFHNRPLE